MSTRYQKLEVPDRDSTLHQFCIVLASCPSLQCSFRKKPVSCREAEGLVTELWSPRFATIQWLCSQLCYETAANQRTLVEIEPLATVGWKWGCQPFSCQCSQNVMHCRKEICATCLSKESVPAIPFGNCNHPTPTRSYCIMPIPSLQLQEKTSPMQRSRGFGHRVVVSKICYNTVIVLSVVLWDCCKPTKTCPDWAFSNSELEVGLPAFQLPMFAKCAALPTRDLFHMFV